MAVCNTRSWLDWKLGSLIFSNLKWKGVSLRPALDPLCILDIDCNKSILLASRTLGKKWNTGKQLHQKLSHLFKIVEMQRSLQVTSAWLWLTKYISTEEALRNLHAWSWSGQIPRKRDFKNLMVMALLLARSPHEKTCSLYYTIFMPLCSIFLQCIRAWVL